MSKRKKQVTEENVRYFDLIPTDLLIKILSRLPVKSMAQCRCVSNLWSSIIRSQNYKQLFPIKSSNPPPLRFLFTYLVEKKNLIFLSSPQPQNPNNHSSLVATRHYTNSDVTDLVYKLCHPVNGLVCCQHIGKNYTVVAISNPVTGESVTTPKLMMKEMESKSECYFGYDPIKKQFKVLCAVSYLCQRYNKWRFQHRVLTLETDNLVWRKIKCHKFYVLPNSLDGICINGVLYYTAITKLKRKRRVIVSFDVSSEEFRFIKLVEDLATKRNIDRPLFMRNYKGKLGVFNEYGLFSTFVLWVLENAEEGLWSKHVYQTPLLHLERLNTGYKHSAKEIGTTDSGDIVFCRKYAGENTLYISYYNLESTVMVRVRVEIPGVDVLKYLRIYVSPNFVEDLTLI